MMIQNFAKYTAEDHEIWGLLFDRQIENLKAVGCSDYFASVGELSTVFNNQGVPRFEDLSAILMTKHGWTIEVVPGLIPVEEFFELLSQKKFCSSTWLRSRAQLDYLEEPDMFHDIFGHIPLLMNKPYADFMHKFGEIGMRHMKNPAIIAQLRSLYWFTIEFGLISEAGQRKINGAGIISSNQETAHVYDEKTTVKPFNLKAVLETEFSTSEIQNTYFEIESFEQLFASLEEAEALFSRPSAQR